MKRKKQNSPVREIRQKQSGSKFFLIDLPRSGELTPSPSDPEHQGSPSPWTGGVPVPIRHPTDHFPKKARFGPVLVGPVAAPCGGPRPIEVPAHIKIIPK